ncbi:MAG: hypothetical protein QM638_22555 [Nocardioides sp.]|uniref:hypothetical protein n=1 Tax=Nocardioides sp. TaxID=35761 RepID=UPI0039E5F01F
MPVPPRWAAGAGAVLALAAAVAACSNSNHISGQAAISPAAAVSEYLAEESHVDLAPTWIWPTSVGFPTAGPDGKPMLYQSGYGTTQADHYWYCSWETTLVSATTSPAVAKRARQELARVRQTHMYIADILPVDRPRFNKILDSAIHGRTRLMQRDVKLNCPKEPAAKTSSTAGQ